MLARAVAKETPYARGYFRVDDASQQTEDLSTEVICLLTLERILMMAFIGIDDGDGDDDGNVAHF